MHRILQRSYDLPALELWLERLVSAWEPTFGKDALELGRFWYREGAVRGLEVSRESLIVHSKEGGALWYAVIDWESGRLAVRSSVLDKARGHALAVAGLYELEELITEVLVFLPDESEKTTNSLDENLHQFSKSALGEEGSLRKLCIKVCVTREGLELTALWQGEEGSCVPVLNEAEDTLTHGEREQAILLSMLARRAGFSLDARRGVYLLREFEKIRSFVSSMLVDWKKRFSVECSPDVYALVHGPERVRLVGNAQSKGARGFRFEWQVLAGEDVLSARDMRRLLRGGGVPVFMPGKGALVLPAEDATLVDHWKHSAAGWKEGEVPRYMLFSLFEKAETPWNLDGGLHAWKENVLASPEESIELPKFLRSYQHAGVAWLKHRLGCGCHPLLADEMGLGKTVQVLSLIAADEERTKPSIIVCPATVVPVWLQEVARFFPAIETRMVRTGVVFDGTSCLWVCSYTQLRRHRALLDAVDFDYAVLDEAQFIKNPDTKVAHACMQLNAKHRIALTGTPIENKHLDLWTIFRFLMPGLLGTRATFERKVMHDGEVFLSALKRQIAPFVLRRTKQAVLKELPDKVEVVLPCPLTDLQRVAYQKIVEEAKRELSGEQENAMHLFTWLLRLRQAACDPALLPSHEQVSYEQSGKLLALLDRLEPVFDSGSKVVIFSQFVRFLERVECALQERFPDIARFKLIGDTKDRSAPVRHFQESTRAACFLGSLRAGGTGITLHDADYVFLLDPWWNPAVEAQAVDRVHRLGQQKKVMIYRLIAPGTLEERIQTLKEHKHALFDALVGQLGTLSDIEQYFASLGALIDYKE